MFLLIKTYLIGPYWTIRNNYMVASSATNPILDHLPTQKNCSHCNFTFAERLTFKSKFGQGI